MILCNVILPQPQAKANTIVYSHRCSLNLLFSEYEIETFFDSF